MNTNIDVTTENTYDGFLALLRNALWGEDRFPFPMIGMRFARNWLVSPQT